MSEEALANKMSYLCGMRYADDGKRNVDDIRQYMAMKEHLFKLRAGAFRQRDPDTEVSRTAAINALEYGEMQ